MAPPTQKKDENLPTFSSTPWSDDSDDDFVPDFEPEDSEEEDDGKDFKLPIPNIKKETCDYFDDEDMEVTNIQIEPLLEFEYNRLDNYDADVKDEDDDKSNLFDDKDKILEHLLNENDYHEKSDKEGVKRKRPYKARHKTTDSDDILEETEVVFIKYEDSDDSDFPKEDILKEEKKPVSK